MKHCCGVQATTGVVVLKGSRKGNDCSLVIYENNFYSTGRLWNALLLEIDWNCYGLEWGEEI